MRSILIETPISVINAWIDLCDGCRGQTLHRQKVAGPTDFWSWGGETLVCSVSESLERHLSRLLSQEIILLRENTLESLIPSVNYQDTV